MRGSIRVFDPAINEVSTWPKVYSFATSLKVGDEIHPITSSLNRYGQFIVHGRNREEINRLIESYEHRIYSFINVTSK